MIHYQIEYYNKLWRDWIAFDQLFYKTEADAQKRIDEYKDSVPAIEMRIIRTEILVQKNKKQRKKVKVTTEKI